MIGSMAAIAGVAVALFAAGGPQGKSLVERLGYAPGDRLLIVNGDDTGMCHSANLGTFACLDSGRMTSATIMTPCPWFLEVVAYAKAHPGRDFGVHLTHTSEWRHYRWPPVLGKPAVPRLADPDGYLWESVEDVYKHATPQDAAKEARAQIQRALAAGIDVTHIDSHMGTMQYNVEYHRLYLKLAREFNLPARMGSPETYIRAGFPGIRDEARKMGIVFPDRLVHEEDPEPGESRKAFWLRIIKGLKPEVTELYIHASVDSAESRSTSNTWKDRAEDCELFSTDPDIAAAIAEGHIHLIGYRPLRDLQRKESASATRR